MVGGGGGGAGMVKLRGVGVWRFVLFLVLTTTPHTKMLGLPGGPIHEHFRLVLRLFEGGFSNSVPWSWFHLQRGTGGRGVGAWEGRGRRFELRIV